MEKLRIFLIGIAACTMVSAASAQIALRAGGAMIFDGSQPGGHVSIIVPFSSKPAGLMIAADYYKKSGLTTLPISARGLYNLNVGEQADIYIGVGSGLIYTKNETANTSSTKGVFSAVSGLRINASEKFGLFGEVSFDRALTAGANNNVAGKIGIAFTLSE
jgi:hypothetical protein